MKKFTFKVLNSELDDTEDEGNCYWNEDIISQNEAGRAPCSVNVKTSNHLTFYGEKECYIMNILGAENFLTD